ncbi:MAG: AbrB/MazE/SpoVT family DNA-binding domain-containing protein [Candidatus Omnitrophica bacterium]|nr:AbrB/MazE/SpoVT family DNA-binding domain-containing protein [Candidatus Omnitrophota bacterium]
MFLLEKTSKISSKGQITLPKEVRERLQSDVIRIVMEEDSIRIEPVTSVAGSLSRYAKGKKTSHRVAREKAWENAARERHFRR